eukprot:gnl/MRDRNA2_/MRDRNA2_127328_c0_seq1.p1 gnl/MRDRNA2_/MRDRNA2_127328_c0~~gnl/MRDRNA2_/MRDRNA2_127328_c0_seq1.p1  ORF type:complete len:535 (+),score=65.65 gnl/MRDRNA2_/MRDRNA2_127328_c0_seq1:86-1690(+)
MAVPWAPLPGGPAPFPLPPVAVAGVAETEETLYESAEGDFVAAHEKRSGLIHEQSTRRCFSLSPEPTIDGTPLSSGSIVSSSAFRRSSRVEYTAVCRTACMSQSRSWGRVGDLLSAILPRGDLIAQMMLEHWLLSLISYSSKALRKALSREAQNTTLGFSDAPVAFQWHPQRDLLGVVSKNGIVSLHYLDSSPNAGTTRYLHDDAVGGRALCLSWQANELEETLAVGTTTGIVVWRRSVQGSFTPDGWWRLWSMEGGPFVCPALAWSPDGRSLATAGANGIVHVWPHSGMHTHQEIPYVVTLRRWASSCVAGISWSPDGSLLAVTHPVERVIRIWDTHTWDIRSRIGMPGNIMCAPAWCVDGPLLGAASEGLFEIRNLGVGATHWATSVYPECRALPMPSLITPGSDERSATARTILGIAVCPRSAQRLAVIFEGSPMVLVFERVASDAAGLTSKLALRGLLGVAPRGTMQVRPLAVSFAECPVIKSPCDALFEGSLLAVLWDFGDGGSEVRTYPLHYLPQTMLRNGMSGLLDW